MTKDATLDIVEIASAPIGKQNLLTMWSTRVDGEVRLELAIRGRPCPGPG